MSFICFELMLRRWFHRKSFGGRASQLCDRETWMHICIIDLQTLQIAELGKGISYMNYFEKHNINEVERWNNGFFNFYSCIEFIEEGYREVCVNYCWYNQLISLYYGKQQIVTSVLNLLIIKDLLLTFSHKRKQYCWK